MRFTFILILSVVALASLSACGDTLGKQAVIGAGAGAGTALVVGGNVAGGALVGAGANVAYCQAFPGRC
ncbi:hypothetical protein [Roseovarius aestuarii]|uniref:Lipoprotein n=1 Tax=Roseovarius aestuarii TaxID=475083 RepID=A0A1X7BSH2_9RHOB|nr:hypothetical protein [Roseovarius aestuarii]SMC12562.1 hypothetical protein ROA7745_02390 [Roseovarius aestuarii]